MPVKSPDGHSEFVGCCQLHAEEIPKYMIEGEVIVISKMNDSGKKLGYNDCEYEMGEPPSPCGNSADYIIERGFPIQD